MSLDIRRPTQSRAKARSRRSLPWLKAASIAAALTAALLSGHETAKADYPERPVRLVLPLSPGGPTDVLARTLAKLLEPVLNQPVIVENRTGANSQIATEYVASQPADGYTLLIPTNSLSTIGITNANFKKDVLKMLQPITMLEQRPLIVVASSKAPFKTFAELLEYGRNNPDKLTCGVVGAINQLSAAWINEAAGMKTKLVPYGGSAPAYIALLRGEIDYHQTFVESIEQHIQSGALRVIATLGEKRGTQFPDLPTVNEFLPGVYWTAWTGLLAPAGTPRPIVDKLNKLVTALLAGPELSAMLEKQGSLASPMSPEQFGERIAADRANFERVAKEANLTFQ